MLKKKRLLALRAHGWCGAGPVFMPLLLHHATNWQPTNNFTNVFRSESLAGFLSVVEEARMLILRRATTKFSASVNHHWRESGLVVASGYLVTRPPQWK